MSRCRAGPPFAVSQSILGTGATAADQVGTVGAGIQINRVDPPDPNNCGRRRCGTIESDRDPHARIRTHTSDQERAAHENRTLGSGEGDAAPPSNPLRPAPLAAQPAGARPPVFWHTDACVRGTSVAGPALPDGQGRATALPPCRPRSRPRPRARRYRSSRRSAPGRAGPPGSVWRSNQAGRGLLQLSARASCPS